MALLHQGRQGCTRTLGLPVALVLPLQTVFGPLLRSSVYFGTSPCEE